MVNPNGSTEDQLRAQTAALADFGLYAFQCQDLDDLLHRAAELVSDTCNVDLVKILEHRPETADLLIRAGMNWQPGVVGHVALGAHKLSPAGYALQTSEPVVSPDVDSETRFEIPQVLVRHNVRSMVNVIIAGAQKPFGVLEVDAREKRVFDDDDIRFLRTYANVLAAAVERIRSHRKLEDTAREQRILTHEFRHRVQNLLGLVQALVSQTSADDRTAEAFKEVVVGRIQALAVAEDVVFQNDSDEVNMRRVADAALAPYGDPVRIEGPQVRLPARCARMIGLALHELATNAAKHGALSAPEGHVHLQWRSEIREDAKQLELVWSEHGGPRVSPPNHRGFGSRLLERVLPGEIGGTSELAYHSAGVAFRLTFPLD